MLNIKKECKKLSSMIDFILMYKERKVGLLELIDELESAYDNLITASLEWAEMFCWNICLLDTEYALVATHEKGGFSIKDIQKIETVIKDLLCLIVQKIKDYLVSLEDFDAELLAIQALIKKYALQEIDSDKSLMRQREQRFHRQLFFVRETIVNYKNKRTSLKQLVKAERLLLEPFKNMEDSWGIGIFEQYDQLNEKYTSCERADKEIESGFLKKIDEHIDLIEKYAHENMKQYEPYLDEWTMR